MLLHLADALIALIAIEAVALWAWHRATGRGLRPRAFVPNLLAGGLLIVAARCALTPGLVEAAAASAAAAGLCHALDLRMRWRDDARP